MDTSASFLDVNLSALDQTDLLVLVAAPDVATLKTTQTCLRIFAQVLGTPGERRVLLNTIHRRARLERADIEKTLGEHIDAVVPYSEELVESIDHGTPLATSAPEHPIFQVLGGFVRQIAQVPDAATTTSRSGFWVRRK